MRRRSARPAPVVPGPKLRLRTSPYWEPRVNAWAVPFPGADASVVRRTQAALTSLAGGFRPTAFAMYFTLPSRWLLYQYLVLGGLVLWLAGREWGRRLLLRHPEVFTRGLFSREGPTEAQMAASSFSMTLFGRGYSTAAKAEAGGRPDKEVATRLTGPEPGYVATPVFLLAAAQTLLEERGRLPANGGVMTAGTAFGRTTLLERLRRRGIGLSVLEEKAVV